MFPSLAVIKERLLETIGKFRRENATNPDKAMSAVELGLPSEFEWLMQGPLRQLGVFVEVDGKYYLSEKRAKEVEKNFDKIAEDFLVDRALSPPPRFRYWMRHTASVPKGFLRYRVFQLLKEQPRSGSEIMSEIERETGGHWKPSPGSIYPLLAWLQDNGYTEEVPAKATGMKYYRLTEKGLGFLREQSRLQEKVQEKLEYFTPPFFGGLGFTPNPEKLRKLREPIRQFLKALLDLRVVLEENLTDQSLGETRDLLNSTTKRIVAFRKKLEKGH